MYPNICRNYYIGTSTEHDITDLVCLFLILGFLENPGLLITVCSTALAIVTKPLDYSDRLSV